MSLTYLTAAVANAMVEAAYPSNTISHTASATNGTTTLTFTASEALSISVGMTVTGAGITSGGLVVTNPGTGVVTISGTITTLTASSYVFTRQTIAFGAPASGVKTSTTAQNWTSMPAVTVAYFGFWSAVTSGTWLGGGTLGSSLTVPAAATVAAAIGAITATVSG